ncbi:MAG: site-specific integrase [Planctomycetes bacterium]|nr:site-specific integrase [Planctomycetota bacterium]
MGRPAKPWIRSSDGAWYATLNGKQTPLEVRGRENEAAAWVAFEQLRSGIRPTPLPTPAAAPQPTTKAVTVREVVDEFLSDSKDRVEPTTLEVYRFFLSILTQSMGGLTVGEVTVPAVEKCSRREGWSQSTRSAFLAAAVRAFRFAERSRMIDRTPLAYLKRPAMTSRAADVLITDQQKKQLLQVSPPPFARFLQFIWLTGCRPSECAGLTADDIDWREKSAKVTRHKTAKKGMRRVLPLPPAAVALLRSLADEHPTGILFRNRIGARWHKATWGAAMRTACERAELPRRIVYGLRHSFATDALTAGIPDTTVAAMMGHANTSQLHRHYSHVGSRMKLLTDAVKKVR